MRTNKEVVILVGIPGSGKSTLASTYKSRGYLVLNADSIRGELFGDESHQANNVEVFEVFHDRLEKAMEAGTPIVADNTNVTRNSRRKIIQAARIYDYSVTLIYVRCPVEVRISRQSSRARQVPDYVIRKMYETLLAQFPEGIEADKFEVYESDYEKQR